MLEHLYEVTTNRKHKLNLEVFHVKGKDRAKPDMMIKTPITKEWYAVEIKTAEKQKNVLDSTKILTKYYYNYLEGKTSYYLRNEKINIKGFLVATKFSKEGHLFKDETFEEIEIYTTIPDRIPQLEGNKTQLFLRQLWNNYKQERDKRKQQATENIPSVGILISHLNTYKEKQNTSPLIQVMGTYLNVNKNKWQYSQTLVKI